MPGESNDNYFYTWTDLTWSPAEWFWFGISGQRTRLYETELDLQHGLIVGGGFGNWELTGYFYNPGKEYRFFLASLTWNFE